jgi:dTDP-4-dehydrorhamnose 3,5-epimerase
VSFSFEPTAIPEVVRVAPTVRGDDRGFFLERYKASAYAAHGIGPFVQDNHSRSARGVLRGLHWQLPPHAQGKLVSVLRGRILDVAVDLRRGSATFGRWVAAELDDRTFEQLWVPPGFAHGFVVLSEEADVHYKTTAEYAPDAERGLSWNDPDVAVDWGVDAPRVSARDAALPRLARLRDDDLFDAGATP